MRKVMLIGAGGIGSYLADFLSRINHAKTGKLYSLTVFDDDKIETKNLSYQNFHPDEVGKHKVMSLYDKFECDAEPYPVLVKEQLKGYDLVVCCADNLAVRRLLYRQGYGEEAEIKWLDLRAQARNAALISYKTDANLVDTFLSGPEGSFSCQGGDWDGSGKDINTMHMAIAGIATQWIQRWFVDNDDVADKMVINV
tara:strand:+ start:37 stop:627 length:591 start_codon:yes stop_codon:yes gene_type:complete